MARQVEFCCRAEVTPAQCHALLELEETGPVPNGELAARLQVDASTLSRTIDHLVEKGLVARETHPGDRRATLLELSQRGGEVAAGIHETADALYRDILDNLPADRRGEVLRRFSQLVDGFGRWQERGGCRGG